MYISYGPMTLLVTANEFGVTNIDFITDKHELSPPTQMEASHLDLAKKELLAYFNHDLTNFTVPINFVTGTDFQKNVWSALTDIPYGETKNYQDIARLIDSPRAQQAVGQANRHNPIPIIIPCHRVIGKNGKLTGYSGNSEQGLIIKQYLLDLEQKK